jgi:trehalose 6-phosphate phosphatase
VTSAGLAAVSADPARAAILLDFDGTLAPIVSRPEDAGIVDGGPEVLGSLLERYLAVAIISGRPGDVLRELVGVDGIRYEGLYGLGPTAGGNVDDEFGDDVQAVTAAVAGAWVERKGVTLAVHYRHAPDPPAAREELASPLADIALRRGYDLLEGKMVFELAPAGESRKGGAVTRIVRETGARAALYAGDDLPDLEAFAALDALGQEGISTVKIAVGGAETPTALTDAADVVVAAPRELVELLRTLLPRPPAPGR